MKIVKFKDGTYGIRKFSLCLFEFGYVFKDLKSRRFWWYTNDKWFDECKGTLEQCKYVLQILKDKGEILK